ncbi:MAG: hypothetical protein ACQGVK_12795 [Myxococcota bacterium]
MLIRRLAAILILSTFVAPVALGRSDMVDLDVKQAVADSSGKRPMEDIRYYMKGQKHGAVTESLGVFKANRATNAFNKSDEQACSIAFVSALLALQARAKKQGGNAVVDIRSLTNLDNLESPTQFRCTAGNIVAKVVLEGRVVKMK